MAKPPSEKQAAYRATLISQCLDCARPASLFGVTGVTALEVEVAGKSANPDDWYIDVRGQRIAGLAFALALPEPADSADCSEQISALQSGSAWGYAESHREWGTEILGRLTAHYGEDLDALPKVVTARELRAVATGARNG